MIELRNPNRWFILERLPILIEPTNKLSKLRQIHNSGRTLFYTWLKKRVKVLRLLGA